MTKTFKKLATATLSAAICLVALKANPAQAAKFNFSSNNYTSPVFGYLSFDDETSGLTGIGREEVTLSPLNGNLDFSLTNFFGYGGIVALITWTNSDFLTPPVFTFESGSLIGMNLNLPPKTVNGYVPGPGGWPWSETSQVSVQDTSYRVKNLSVILSRYNYYCTLYPYTQIPDPPYFVYDIEKCRIPEMRISSESTGELQFQTIVPFQRPTSVPEPSSVVGLSLLGLAFLLKKKTASSPG